MNEEGQAAHEMLARATRLRETATPGTQDEHDAEADRCIARAHVWAQLSTAAQIEYLRREITYPRG